MITMKSNKVLEHYIALGGIDDYFSTFNPKLMLFRYNPGEYLASPFSPLEYLQFLVEGQVHLYRMPDEASTVSIGASYRKIQVIGEMELLDPHFIPFFVEAATEVTTVALHIGQNREQLMKDPAFLRMLCVSLSKKLEDATQQSERLPLRALVRNSMRHMEPGECITGIGKLAESVNVSTRQLIRVLNEYCELGVLKHEQRGVYRIIRKVPALPE